MTDKDKKFKFRVTITHNARFTADVEVVRENEEENQFDMEQRACDIVRGMADTADPREFTFCGESDWECVNLDMLRDKFVKDGDCDD